jgi:Pro-kumamolisin, activation domain/Bacterial Ig-like domain (group 3)
MQRPALLAVLVGLALTALAQDQATIASSTSSNYVRALITQPVDETRVTTLKGNTHPLARPQFDVGGAPGNLPLDRMLLVLKRTPEQQAALTKLLDDQQDVNSPNYHKWLTPDEFGREFGPADQDIQTVTSWLHSHGFRVDHVSRGRTVIEFSGDAGQVQQAFGTAIHKYAIRGEEHWANAADPTIPAALVPAVAGIATLHNFHSKPQHVISPNKATITYVNSKPQMNFSGGVHALGPADYATIYNLNPLYQAGINGSGISIAVVARSDINAFDLFDFQSTFDLQGTAPLNSPITVWSGPDPGDVPGDDLEATLDVSWSMAVARNANITLVVAASTNTTDGVDLSKLHIVENNLADVMTESFGTCEAAHTSAELAAISFVNEQAAAQGITHLVSTGDTGSAGCDNLSETVASGPVSVNALASTPFTVAVGGTLFNDTASPSTYWNSTNNSTTLASVKSYIPEKVWNETCTTTCTPNDAPLAAGGGGASIVSHSVVFAKPSWQSGVSGIPNDGARDVPDVSLTAAIHDGYVVCFAGSCSQGSAFIVGGTSASAPAFAGMIALVDQKMAQINPSQGARQGQANYVLYKLAAKETFSSCNASSKPAAACIFNDVTGGNNCVPGLPGYGPSCTTYAAKTGFDMATGLGSVNATNLVNNWNTVTFRPTLTTLTLNSGNPVSITHGQAVPVQVTVAPGSGTGTPTGDVSLVTNLINGLAGFALFTLNTGSVTSNTSALPGGSYQVTAHYAGDGTFAPSDSSPSLVTVTPEASTTTLAIFGFDQAGHMFPFNSASYGSPAYLRADVAGQSGNGTPTGDVFFNDGVNFGMLNTLNSQGNTETANGVFNIAPGTHAMVAHYLGDQSFSGSTSSPSINIAITPGPTTTSVVSSANTLGFGSNVDLTATISTSSAGNPVSNNVTFLTGGTQVGSSPAILSRAGIGNLQSGQFQTTQSTATFSTSQLPLGQNTITALYAGDSNYLGSTSAPVVVNVVPDFSLPATLSPISIAAPGQSGTTTLTITGKTSYNGTLNFTAASCSGLPSLATCSFSPTSVKGSGKTTITVSTTAPHSASLQHFGLWTSGGGLLAGVFFFGLPLHFPRRRLFGLLAMACLATAVGCGGGGGGGSSPPIPGTPAGTYNVTISATSSGLTHTTSFTLTVQ